MSSPTNYQRYASQWMDLFDAFKDEPKQIRIVNCGSAKKARALRSEFYKAREAFLKDEDMNREYGAVLNSREVKVDEKAGDVIFDCKDNNWVAKLIDKSLKSKGDGQDESGRSTVQGSEEGKS